VTTSTFVFSGVRTSSGESRLFDSTPAMRNLLLVDGQRI
jgi:hypothetical protein